MKIYLVRLINYDQIELTIKNVVQKNIYNDEDGVNLKNAFYKMNRYINKKNPLSSALVNFHSDLSNLGQRVLNRWSKLSE